MKLPDFDLESPSDAVARMSTQQLALVAAACIDELRERGRALGLEGDRHHHGDALRAVESLAGSAREAFERAKPANDNGR